MHGTAAIGRAKSPGGFVSHAAPDAVAEESKRHSHERIECIGELLDQGVHRAQRRLGESRGTSRQLHGTEIDLGRHEAPQRPIERRSAPSVGKTKHAAANRRAFSSKRYPPVERHCGSCSAAGLSGGWKEPPPKVTPSRTALNAGV